MKSFMNRHKSLLDLSSPRQEDTIPYQVDSIGAPKMNIGEKRILGTQISTLGFFKNLLVFLMINKRCYFYMLGTFQYNT